LARSAPSRAIHSRLQSSRSPVGSLQPAVTSLQFPQVDVPVQAVSFRSLPLANGRLAAPTDDVTRNQPRRADARCSRPEGLPNLHQMQVRMDTKCVILINEFRVLEDEADAPTEAPGEHLGQSPTRSSFSLTAETGRDAVSGPLSPASSTRSRQQWQAALYKKTGRTTPRNGTVGSCQGQSPLTNPYNRQSQRDPNDDTRQRGHALHGRRAHPARLSILQNEISFCFGRPTIPAWADWY